MTTLAALHEEAEQHLARGEYADALRCYHRLLEANPLHCEARLGIGRALGGLKDAATKDVFVSAVRHALRFGAPLVGLWGVARLAQERDARASILAREAATLYAAKESTPAQPTTPSTQPSPPSKELPFIEVVTQAKRLALQEHEPPAGLPLPSISILSLLPKPAFAALCLLMKAQELTPGQIAFREGEPSSSLYLVVSGKLLITRRGQEEPPQEPNACVGETALLSNSARLFTAKAGPPTRLLEISREALVEISKKIPEINEPLQRFVRERLLRNLLATAPIFRPFPKKRRVELFKNFTGHDVALGTTIISEGQEGKGLYVLLSGSVEVSKGQGAEKISLAILHGGDVFGEMSLIQKKPTNASVIAKEASQILFLSREVFQKLLDSEPALKEFFQKLSQDRAKAIEQMMSIEEISIEEELDIE